MDEKAITAMIEEYGEGSPYVVDFEKRIVIYEFWSDFPFTFDEIAESLYCTKHGF